MRFFRRFIIVIFIFALFTLPAMSYSAQLTDMAGRKVDTPKEVKRIVTTFKPATLCVISLGLADRLVGVDRASRTDSLQVAVFPPIAKVPSVGDRGGGLNFETIVSLQPDLVILYSQLDGVAVAERLERLGIPSIIINPESFDDIRHTLEVIAQASGNPGAAERAVGVMNRTVDMVRVKVGQPAKRPAVYYASPQGTFYTVSGDMLQNKMVELAGGRNVSSELTGHFRPISPEQLVAWLPDIIVISRYCPDYVPKMLSGPQYASIPAVKNNRIFEFPSNLAPWDYPSPLSALGVAWLAWRMHPEAMAEVDMLKLADEFHKDLFGRTFTELGGKTAPLRKGDPQP